MSKSIYRGYDIRQEGGVFKVYANDKPCDGHGGDWKTEEAAMDAIDSRLRSRVEAGLDPVGD